MKKLAYITIDDKMTPRKAADDLGTAKNSGVEDILVLHEENAPFYTTRYKEQLLSLFRGAYRNKVRLYIGDDSAFYSGTGFGQVCSVRDVRLKCMRRKNKSEVTRDEEIIAEKGEECVAVSFCEDTAEKFGFYPDVTNPECARLVTDAVYAPLLREFAKFKGYEFAGFFCNRPFASAVLGKDTAYMPSVVDRFEKEYNKTPDFFELADRKGDFEAYDALCKKLVEENFLGPLLEYCNSNGVELIVGSACGEYGDFCRKHSLLPVTTGVAKGMCSLGVSEIAAVVAAREKGGGCVFKIMPGMEKLVKLQNFFESNSHGEVVALDEFVKSDKDCYIIKGCCNTKSVGLLLEGDWCIADWENNVLYDFEKKAVYTIYPDGFLCIKRKTADMYTEPLPIRVGGVLTKELKTTSSVRFRQEGESFTFTLPEEALSGKYICFSTSGSYISVKMGYNRYDCISSPCVYPLYDFLCGSVCEGVTDGGVLTDISIMEKS